MITLQVRYTIDHHKHREFEEYCRDWGAAVERAGGKYLGHFLPTYLSGDTSDALALIEFENTAAYENFRNVLAEDKVAQAKAKHATETKCIVKEVRSFMRKFG